MGLYSLILFDKGRFFVIIWGFVVVAVALSIYIQESVFLASTLELRDIRSQGLFYTQYNLVADTLQNTLIY